MITVDAPICFLVGGGLALACRDGAQSRVRNRDRLLIRGLLFQSMLLSPVILYFMLRFPDWEWIYLFDARSFFFGGQGFALGSLLLVVAVALLNLSFYVGFRVVEWLVARHQVRWAQGLLIAVLLAMGAILLATFEQTVHVGSLAAYRAHEAPLVLNHLEFLLTQTIAAVLVAAALWWLIRTNQSPG